ncbi:MAG: CoA pyrophosphatase [bacterium]|nr:CoA pyrophosphatase [bacterium]
MTDGFGALADRLRTLETEPRGASARRAAVAIALQARPHGLEVLLMRRVEHADDPWSGQVSLPGGHVEDHDADLAATARREAHEELAVDLERSGDLIGPLEPVQARARGRLIETWIHPFVFAVREDLDPRPGPEASEAFWLPLGRARSGELDADYRYPDGELVRILPSWSFEGRTVWGLTHHIIARFLELAGNAVEGPRRP